MKKLFPENARKHFFRDWLAHTKDHQISAARPPGGSRENAARARPRRERRLRRLFAGGATEPSRRRPRGRGRGGGAGPSATDRYGHENAGRVLLARRARVSLRAARRARDRAIARAQSVRKRRQARFFGSALRSKSGGRVRTLGLASWVWMRSLTRSMGAVAVLAIEPEMPPCEDAVSRRRKRAGQRGRDAGARRAHNKMCKANPSRARPDARGGARERATATRAFGHRRAS